METPESIERILEERLVPRALSESGSASLAALIDELADESPQVGVRWTRFLVGGAAAAVLTFTAIMTSMPSANEVPVVGVDELFSGNRDVVLIEDLEGVVSAEPNVGLVADDDGSLHRAWHVQVVSEERFRDEQSGEVVTVVHPRDEVVLMPVTAF